MLPCGAAADCAQLWDGTYGTLVQTFTEHQARVMPPAVSHLLRPCSHPWRAAGHGCNPNPHPHARCVTAVQADVLATDRTLLSARYDNIDAGGLLAKRTSNSLIGFQAKQYVRPNIALSLREDVNVREDGAGAERAFRHATMIGLDVAF